jgi:hypothetical protein
MTQPPLTSPYGFIAIEGNIGAGKTTLATRLAERLGAQLILERFEENPFLERFYADPAAHGFSVELAFVSDRWKQMRDELGRRNLFRPTLVADYAFAKSLVFARENLRLQLLNARLNLLARNVGLFRGDLARAQRIIERWFDPKHTAVANGQASLRQLQGTPLAVELPAPSESIAAVRAARASSDAR